MKAQMFIITMVFLVGLIFAVQLSLSQYNEIDLAKAFQNNDIYLLSSVKKSFSSTLTSSLTCEEAADNLRELELFLEKNIVEGTSIEISYILDCAQWGATPLNLTVHLKSISFDTTETVQLSNN